MVMEAVIQAARGEKSAMVFPSLSLACYNTNSIMCHSDTNVIAVPSWFVIGLEILSTGEFMPSTTDLIKGLWLARF